MLVNKANITPLTLVKILIILFIKFIYIIGEEYTKLGIA